jgi:hypothetical protein
MHRALITVVTVLAAALAGSSAWAAPPGDAGEWEHLDPGGQPRLTETVPVNVVFVGYDEDQVGRAEFEGELPAGYEPVVRSRLFYGITEALGIEYTYDYDVRYADTSYEDAFFAELSRLATPAPLTLYQQAYNDQDGNVLDVRDNHHIDAPSVERWLAEHPPQGVDTARNTVFFINWHGRSDFRNHVYTKTNEPDPDTGFNFGAELDSRKLIAWGGTPADDEEDGRGTTRRVWFHDLSAGPESWTANWNVDDPDLDDNGVEDYRMPPVWEYAPGGFRGRAALAHDLGLITRYVAINLLFTSSPLYPPELPTARPPGTVDIDSNTYEGWPGVDASEAFITPDLVVDELAELRWRDELTYDNQDLPFTGAARRCYVGLLEDRSCYPRLGYPSFGNLFLQNTFQLERTKDDGAAVDYELPVFNYAVGAGVGTPALGFADDNYQDGTQSYVFAFVSPEIVDSGYGLTTTIIHEVGHHVGMAHPHDGYDSASGVDYGPADQFFFAWAGDEHNSMMSYIDLNWDFSQFDRDNSDRFVTAGYLEAANMLAAEVVAAGDRRTRGDLLRADRLVGSTQEAFAAHDYRQASALADRAYAAVERAAERAGVPSDTARRQLAAEAEAARASGAVHESDEFIDTLTEGPRSQP